MQKNHHTQAQTNNKHTHAQMCSRVRIKHSLRPFALYMLCKLWNRSQITIICSRRGLRASTH